ncbi:MAG: D-alanyl-D-alanine carboxypeptidase [Turicibacter sp.]|nr:D-alanyl-D-alanine carboxypeptidase [Turicibacter sp.]
MKKKMLKVLLVIGLVGAVAANGVVYAIEDITSECGIVMEQITGRVLFEKCADEEMYVASITKILTAIIAIENAELDDWVDIASEDVHQVGSSLYLVDGDRMLLEDLLYGLMLRSGNDAAWAIARYVGGGDVAVFVALMNEKAAEIGMTNSLFQNPSGLDETTYNLSTARDMALLQRYAMNNPIFREITYESLYETTSEQGKRFVWKNKHRLLNGRYEHAISGKTGYTEQAKRTLVTSANNGEIELVAVTIKGGNDWNDHTRMFEYGFKNFELRQVLEIGELQMLEDDLLELAGFDRLFVREERSVFVRPGEYVRKHLVMENLDNEEAVGVLEILIDDEVVDQIDVYAFFDAPTNSWWGRIVDWIVGS